MSKNQEYSIIILTNRHYYFPRLIEYYEKLGESSHVLVLDASRTPFDGVLPAALKYHHFPEMSIMQRLKSGMELTDAKYVSLCADDDFVFPDRIKKYATFLMQNKEYSAVFGRYIRFSIKNEISYTDQYRRDLYRDIAQNDPGERAADIMQKYIQLVYAIHRRETIECLFGVEALYDDQNNVNALGERTFSVLVALLGKIKYINEAFSIREQENQKTPRRQSLLSIARSWVGCNDALVRMVRDHRVDSPAVLQAIENFVERGLHDHFGSMKETPADGGEPLSYITYRGSKLIPSNFSHIRTMGLDDPVSALQMTRMADIFLKNFVKEHVCAVASGPSDSSEPLATKGNT